MSNDSRTTFTYNCAQNAKRQKKSQKVSDPTKQRDKDCMDTFDCHGWLSITVSDSSDQAVVTLVHRTSHIPYCSIDLPGDVSEIIQKNPDYTVSQVFIYPELNAEY